MKREEYMSALKEALGGFDEELVQEIITDYEERFRVGAERGRTEEEIIEELGTVEDLVEEVSELLGIEVESNRKQTDVQINITVENSAEENAEKENSTEENAEERTEQSDTGENEQPFTDSIDDFIAKAMEQAGKAIDAATKEVGKIDIDKIMKEAEEAAHEAGKAVYEAGQAVKESFKKQNVTWEKNGNSWDVTWNERDSADKKAYYSEKGEEGCQRVVVQGEIADVHIEGTDEVLPSASCTQYSYKNAMVYPFYSYQNGDTFYVGIRRNEGSTERKSGFFRINNTPSIELTVRIPRGVKSVEINSGSGDMEIERVETEKLLVTTKSGDVELADIRSNNCRLESLSGDIEVRRIEGETMEFEASSGDIGIEDVKGTNLQFRVKSGDVSLSDCSLNELKGSLLSGEAELERVDADALYIVAASGDINLQTVRANIQNINTSSGEIEVDVCSGNQISASTAIGDISISGSYQEYRVKTSSGDIDLCCDGDADIIAESTIGDISVQMQKVAALYKVTANSAIGDTYVSGQKNSIGSDGAGEQRTITVKTNSGDINVDFI